MKSTAAPDQEQRKGDQQCNSAHYQIERKLAVNRAPLRVSEGELLCRTVQKLRVHMLLGEEGCEPTEKTTDCLSDGAENRERPLGKAGEHLRGRICQQNTEQGYSAADAQKNSNQ